MPSPIPPAGINGRAAKWRAILSAGPERERRGQARDHHHPPHPRDQRGLLGGRFGRGRCRSWRCSLGLIQERGNRFCGKVRVNEASPNIGQGWKCTSTATRGRPGSTGCWRARCPELSRSRLKALILDGRVVTRRPVRDPAYHVARRRHDHHRRAAAGWRPEPAGEDIPLDILYEDDDLIVINKPRGHGGPSGRRPRAAPWSMRCSLTAAAACPASTASSAPASSTGSTRTPPGSWSRPRPIRANRLARNSPTTAAPGRSTAPTSPSPGATPSRPAAPSTRRSAATRTTAMKQAVREDGREAITH